MKNKNILWLYLFLIASLIDMALLVEHINNWRFFSKPLILLSLIGYFYQITKPISWTILSKAVMGALIFSWIGDVLLMWSEFFIYGLGAFFLAHVCYIIAFKVAQLNHTKLADVNFIKAFFHNLPIYLVAAFIYYMINPQLGNLKIPVILYIIIIVSMVSTARERFQKSNAASFWQVFIGACFFFVSDGILALNKFYQPFSEAGILIMGTYVIAQLLIVMGIRSHMIQPK
ncbi:lysoplasmalogenase [Algoriphagus sp. CAU 1675]|uniref:lysoplasmalogenase n=1 Tax=Algoriphagus sp. CAU 1675 TaxID=3032597 RepID=UPI0023DAE91F|nr:lysoplasmalogenase [Algoriphagus sp. CAU 1675]MDF2158953.1 lysoplasmalogenase [Algoriphagus sp. CAU 1675]